MLSLTEIAECLTDATSGGKAKAALSIPGYSGWRVVEALKPSSILAESARTLVVYRPDQQAGWLMFKNRNSSRLSGVARNESHKYEEIVLRTDDRAAHRYRPAMIGAQTMGFLALWARGEITELDLNQGVFTARYSLHGRDIQHRQIFNSEGTMMNAGKTFSYFPTNLNVSATTIQACGHSIQITDDHLAQTANALMLDFFQPILRVFERGGSLY